MRKKTKAGIAGLTVAAALAVAGIAYADYPIRAIIVTQVNDTGDDAGPKTVELPGGGADGIQGVRGSDEQPALFTLGAGLDIVDDELVVEIPAPTQSSPGRTLNTCFQVSSTKTAFVTYSVDVVTQPTLLGGSLGTVYLETFSDSGCTTGTQEIGRTTSGNAASLALGTSTGTANLTGYVLAGKYAKLRTANVAGTPTFTYRSGQEVQF